MRGFKQPQLDLTTLDTYYEVIFQRRKDSHGDVCWAVGTRCNLSLAVTGTHYFNENAAWKAYQALATHLKQQVAAAREDN